MMGHHKSEKKWKKTRIANTLTPQAPDSSDSNGHPIVASEERGTVKVTEVSPFKDFESRNLMGAAVFFGPGAEVLSVEFASDYSAVQIKCFRLGCDSKSIQRYLKIFGESVALSSIYIIRPSKVLPVIANIVAKDPLFAQRLKITVNTSLRFQAVPKIAVKILQMDSEPDAVSIKHTDNSIEDQIDDRIDDPIDDYIDDPTDDYVDDYTNDHMDNHTVVYQRKQGEKQRKPNCVICWNEAEDPHHTSCGHWYCSACFNRQCLQYSIPIRCEEEFCTKVFELQELKLLLHDTLFEQLLTRSFAIYQHANQKAFGSCPKSHCRQLLYRTSANGAIITCPTCATSICTTCRAPSHKGMTCAAKQHAENVDFVKWKTQHDLRDCPGCGASIESIGGCRIMTCAVCKAQFCWDCMEMWALRRPCKCDQA